MDHYPYYSLSCQSPIPNFYTRQELKNLKWVILRIVFSKLSYRIRNRDSDKKFFDENSAFRVLDQKGFLYSIDTIRKALNSLCLEGICVKVFHPNDRRFRYYRFVIEKDLEIGMKQLNSAFKF